MNNFRNILKTLVVIIAAAIILPVMAIAGNPESSAPPNPVKAIDWNDSQINWVSYEEGLKLLKNKKQNGLLIVYANWCGACKNYSTLFKNSDVVKELKGMILIRSDKNAEPDISKQFSLDGEYVPRTFALDSNGKMSLRIRKKLFRML